MDRAGARVRDDVAAEALICVTAEGVPELFETVVAVPLHRWLGLRLVDPSDPADGWR